MKKSVLFLLLIACVAITSRAQELKFYYYPASNVYYNTSQHQYAYLNNGNWIQSASLPPGIKVAPSHRNVVYNPSSEIWVKNEMHVKKYKAAKYQHLSKGKAVGYKGSNPNKALGKGIGRGNKNGKH